MGSVVRTVAVLAVLLPARAAHLSAQPPAVRLVRGPYLQMAGADSIVIVWRTVGKTQPAVKYGKQPDRLDGMVKAPAIHINERPEKGVRGFAKDDELEEGTCQYEARLTGLEPRTTYYYAVCDGETVLAGGDETYRFRTYPPGGEAAPVRFAAFGDSHGAGWLKTGVEKSLADLCARESRPVDFYLSLGDHSSRGRNKEIGFLFEPQDLVRRGLVLWATIGNHDIVAVEGANISGPYADAFVQPTRGEVGGVPSGSEAFYSFDFGRVHFIALASVQLSRDADGPMAKWLQADLARAKADARSDWIIAFFHTPPFTGTGSANKSPFEPDQVEMRATFLPILEAGGVDLVLNGHLHVYERTMLVDGVYSTPPSARNAVLDAGDGDPKGNGAYRKSAGINPHEGEVGVIVGCGGGPNQEGVHPVAKRASLEGGMLVVDISGDTLTARMMRNDGLLRDTFSIVKRGKVTPQRLAEPKPEIAMYYRRKLDGDRFALIPPLNEKVRVDGVLDDPAWPKSFKLMKEKTIREACFFAGPDALYAGIQLETHRRGASVRGTARDSSLMPLDSTIELHLDPGHDAKDVYEFTCNTAGVKRDAANGDLSYNPDWEVSVARGGAGGNEQWVVEMRIPWRSLGMRGPPDEDTVMGVNLVANEGGTGAEWFAGRGDPRLIGLQRAEQFGFLKFGSGRAVALIPAHDQWEYLAGEDPGKAGAAWKAGAAGFGYGDIDNGTPLLDMKGNYARVILRRTFVVKAGAPVKDLGLIINYDDAFIAYLNGTEVLRVGVKGGSGASAKTIAIHEGGGPEYPPDQPINRLTPLEGLPLCPEYFSLRKHLALLRDGANVLTIEGHNASLSSKAFTLDPHLVGVLVD